MARVFPDPDPFDRFIDPEEAPAGLARMDPQTRARSIRLFLISRARLGPAEGSQIAWMFAMDLSPQGVAFADEMVDRFPDDLIVRLMNQTMPKWSRFLADQQNVVPVEPQA